MANAKISALTALTGASVDTAADLLAIVDTSASTTKKILVDELRNAIGPVLSTEQASTSGTSIDFTSIPSWVKKITIQLIGVSTNGTSNLMVQLGDSGGVESSGYNGCVSGIDSSGSGIAGAAFSTGLVIAHAVVAAGTYSGQVILTLEDASDFTWACSGVLARTGTATTFFYAGHKATSAALDRVRITTADTFDAGAINILYE